MRQFHQHIEVLGRRITEVMTRRMAASLPVLLILVASSLQVSAQPLATSPTLSDGPSLTSAESPQQDPNRVFAPLQPETTVGPAPDVQGGDGRFTVRATQSSLGEIVAAIARTSRVDVVLAGEGATKVSLNMYDRPLEDILTAVCLQTGHVWRRHQDVILVSPLATETPYQADVQGRVIEAIQLDYVAAADVQTALQNLLSPVGKLHVMTSAKDDHLKSREVLIVEDLADNVARLVAFAERIDVPPRQVMLEAYVLQVDLDKTQRHGVNFEKAFSWNGTPLSVEMTGFANESPTQAFMARLDASSMTGVLEFLKSETNSRTLASPRLLVVNGQEKRLQVGRQLGYRTVTTTQSGLTQENVNFLDVGVVLSVTPRIADDQRILLNVNSKVSTGLVNPDTGLPEEATSEVDTDVLLDDGYGIVIGGLIQEVDNDSTAGVIGLSDIPYVGGLFRRKQVEKERKEIIFVIVPRILPDPRHPVPGYDCLYERATTPLHDSTCLPSVQYSERGETVESVELLPSPSMSEPTFRDYGNPLPSTLTSRRVTGASSPQPTAPRASRIPAYSRPEARPLRQTSFEEAPEVPPAISLEEPEQRRTGFLRLPKPKLPSWLGGKESSDASGTR